MQLNVRVSRVVNKSCEPARVTSDRGHSVARYYIRSHHPFGQVRRDGGIATTAAQSDYMLICNIAVFTSMRLYDVQLGIAQHLASLHSNNSISKSSGPATIT